MPTRRGYLTALSGGSIVALAGCLNPDRNSDGIQFTGDERGTASFDGYDVELANGEWDAISYEAPAGVKFTGHIVSPTGSANMYAMNETQYSAYSSRDEFTGARQNIQDAVSSRIHFRSETEEDVYFAIDNTDQYGRSGNDDLSGELHVYLP